jgi:isocitrate dehydrogenase (NAD+)
MSEKRVHTVTLIPGDGIGPEVSQAVVEIVDAAASDAGASFHWDKFDAGETAFAKTGEYIPASCGTKGFKEAILEAMAPPA